MRWVERGQGRIGQIEIESDLDFDFETTDTDTDTEVATKEKFGRTTRMC